MNWKSLSLVWLFVTPMDCKFSRPEYWSEYPFPSPGDLFNPGIKPRSPALQADSLLAEPPGKPGITLILIKSPGFCLENFKHNIHLRAFASNYVVFHLHQINHGWNDHPLGFKCPTFHLCWKIAISKWSPLTTLNCITFPHSHLDLLFFIK